MYQADAGQDRIVEALRKAGAVVYLIEGANGIKGVPDLLVAARQRTWLLEVKRPKGPRGGGGGRLSIEQAVFLANWQDRGGPVAVVRSPEEAIAFVFAREAA